MVSGSSTNDSPSSSYTSVRALDKFGQTQQLTNAREAALKGRQIIAASNGVATVVVSQGNQAILHSINLPILSTSGDDDEREHVLAICCSGIKGDASWLISQVQQYVAKVWERYNHHEVSSPAIAHYMSRLLGSFLQMHDVDNEWQSGLRRETAEWARPLGIQTMIVSSNDPYILILDPSGRITKSRHESKNKWSFAGIGMNRELVHDKLSALAKEEKDLGVNQVIQKLVEALRENNPKNGTAETSVEILTRRGIERKLIQFKNGKQISTPTVSMK
jgi:20S proteasome alpha/beta subunit